MLSQSAVELQLKGNKSEQDVSDHAETLDQQCWRAGRTSPYTLTSGGWHSKQQSKPIVHPAWVYGTQYHRTGIQSRHNTWEQQSHPPQACELPVGGGSGKPAVVPDLPQAGEH